MWGGPRAYFLSHVNLIDRLRVGVGVLVVCRTLSETREVRLREWLESDARALQLWGELESLGTVARCDANKEFLKVPFTPRKSSTKKRSSPAQHNMVAACAPAKSVVHTAVFRGAGVSRLELECSSLLELAATEGLACMHT